MLGARIAALRRDAGWSQAELASRLRVSASAIGMYEQGRREPSADSLVALSRIFGVTTDYLLTGQPVAASDQTIASRVLGKALHSAQNMVQSRKTKPFSQEELAEFFTSVLMEP